MTDMVLHWSPRSPFVRKVMIAAHELGLADQLTLRRTIVRMSEPNPDLLADNPLSKIPTMVLSDGAVLFDSGVICEYLDLRAGGNRLLPPHGEPRIRELARHALATGLLDVLILWRNERDKPEGRQTPALLEAFSLKTHASLAQMERDAAPLGAGVLSLSQIAVGCCLSYLDFRFGSFAWREEFPLLAPWSRQFEARPSARAAEIVDA